MANAREKVRHPMLSSAVMRKNFDHLDFSKSAIMAIDQIGDIYDGIKEFRANPPPDMTRDGQEHHFRNSYANAMNTAETIVKSTREKLIAHESNLYKAARAKAGLERNRNDPELVEIRAALRGMSMADRDKALARALDTGDTSVIAAIQDVSSVLIGETTTALDTMTGLFIERANPTIRDDLANVANAIDTFELTVTAFTGEVEKLRDLEAEREADRHKEASKMAEAKLGLAVMERSAT